MHDVSIARAIIICIILWWWFLFRLSREHEAPVVTTQSAFGPASMEIGKRTLSGFL